MCTKTRILDESFYVKGDVYYGRNTNISKSLTHKSCRMKLKFAGRQNLRTTGIKYCVALKKIELFIYENV